jgi:MFS family permease
MRLSNLIPRIPAEGMRLLTRNIAATESRGLILWLLCLTQFLLLMSINLPVVAVPAVGRDLGLPPETAQFVVTAYALAWGALLLMGGRTADLFGRRKILVIGLWVFCAGSLLGSVAWTGSVVIGARAVQGIGAAFVAPAALSMLTTTFAEGAPRDRALAAFGAATAVGAVIGVVGSGLLIDAFGWRAVFAVCLVPAAPLVLLAPRLLPAAPPAATRGRLDVLGAATVTLGLGLLAFGVSQVPEFGFAAPSAGGAVVVALSLLAIFVAIERRGPEPLLPLSLIRRRNIAATTTATVLLWASFASLFFHVSLLLQDVLGYSPLQTGLAYLPLALVTIAAAQLAGRLVGVWKCGPTVALGAVCVCLGSLVLGLVRPGDGFAAAVLPGLLLAGAGNGLALVALQVAIFKGVGQREAGVVAGLFNTAQEVASAVGTVALVSVAASGADVAAGIQSALLVGAAVALAGGVVGGILIPKA